MEHYVPGHFVLDSPDTRQSIKFYGAAHDRTQCRSDTTYWFFVRFIGYNAKVTQTLRTSYFCVSNRSEKKHRSVIVEPHPISQRTCQAFADGWCLLGIGRWDGVTGCSPGLQVVWRHQQSQKAEPVSVWQAEFYSFFRYPKQLFRIYQIISISDIQNNYFRYPK